MSAKATYRLMIFLLVAAFSSCVEPIEFEIPDPQEQIIIQGYISNEPGPYTVSISRGLAVRPDTIANRPVAGAQVRLYDDQGNIENFTETVPGTYSTSGAIQGQVGRSYHIKVSLRDGREFESLPDLMTSGGEIKNVSWEYEEGTSNESFGEIRDDKFGVYIDSDAGLTNDNFIRWRMTGTFRIETRPELYEVVRPYWNIPLKRPWPCSGFRTAPHPSGAGTIVVQIAPCVCCECYVNEYESFPRVSDDRLVSDGEFRNIRVGEVAINNVNFYDKYMVKVEQMSLSRVAYDFFRLMKVQRESASSIFQPPSAELIGNVVPVDPEDRVIGLFWASAIDTEVRFIERTEIPYLLIPTVQVPRPCNTYYPYASTDKPQEWN